MGYYNPLKPFRPHPNQNQYSNGREKIRINKRYELEKIRNDFLKDTKYSYGAAHIQHTVLYPCYAYVEYDRCQVGGDHEDSLSNKHIRTRRCSWLLECDVLQPFELTSTINLFNLSSVSPLLVSVATIKRVVEY